MYIRLEKKRQKKFWQKKGTRKRSGLLPYQTPFLIQ